MVTRVKSPHVTFSLHLNLDLFFATKRKKAKSPMHYTSMTSTGTVIDEIERMTS